MDNLGEIGDALPQETKLMDLPYDLRQKIYNELHTFYDEDLIKMEQKYEDLEQKFATQQRVIAHTPPDRPLQLEGANAKFNEIFKDMSDITKMYQIISLRISNNARLLRRRDEMRFP